MTEILQLQIAYLEREPVSSWNDFIFKPAMNIEGLGQANGVKGKTILPAEARAKMEVRLVLLKPKQVLELIRAQLDKNGFEKIDLCPGTRGKWVIGDMSAPYSMSLIWPNAFIQKGSVSFQQLQASGPMHTVLEVPASLWLPLESKAIVVRSQGDENVKIATTTPYWIN